MSTAIVYCSQTGHTKKYADWLSEELGTKAIPYSDRKDVDITKTELLVFCSWIHAASIKGSKWLKKVMTDHPELRVVVLVSGATPMPSDTWPASEIEDAFRKSFPEADWPDLPYFYCRGGFDYDKLGGPDKLAMKMFFKMNAKSADKDPKVAEMLRIMQPGFDGTRREYLKPLLEHIRSLK
ncbi:MAG: flavodoxin domain-containing protein [Acidobacteriota bacterium]|nr:flavodoxin domain-containing protein [Acidobacteriota bacterium]